MFQKNLTIINIIWLVAIIGIVVTLANFSYKINRLAADIEIINEKISAGINAVNANNNNFASNQFLDSTTDSIPKNSTETELKITDSGFSPTELRINADKINIISITNSGKNYCSFEIKDLDIAIDSIAPGEIMNLVIDRNFPESKNYSFSCSCAAEGDDPQTFEGVLMVLK